MNNFYIYVYLDPRKKGLFKYGEYEFEYEPFYVGKGSGYRWKTINKRSKYFKSILNKIKESGLKPIVIKLKENMMEDDSFLLEIELIELIGRDDLGKGPLVNFTIGGEGVSGYVITEERRKYLSKINSGKNNYFYGIKLLGEKNGMYGKYHSEKTKKLIREKNKGRWLGTRNPKVKLNEEKVRIINQIIYSPIMKKLKITTKEIGGIFNVSKSTIIDIKYKRSWKNIIKE